MSTMCVLACGVQRAAVVFVDRLVDLVPELLVHSDGNVVARSDEKVNEEGILALTYPLQIIHQQTSIALFA